MKLNFKSSIFSLSLIMISSYSFALDLGKLSSGVTAFTGGAESTVDLNTFFANAKVTNQLFFNSRVIFAEALQDSKSADEFKLKLEQLKKATNPKEIKSLTEEINKTADGVFTSMQKDQDATVAKLNELTADKRSKISAAAVNFGLASLKAAELVSSIKPVSSTIMTNPSSLTQTNLSLVEAKDMLGDVKGIASNSTMALVTVPNLLKKSNIVIAVPKSAAEKPVAVSF